MNNEKNVTYVALRGSYLFSKVHICDAKIVDLDDLHFSEVMSFTKLSKMLMGNICNWLLQGNGAITRVLAFCKILAR